MVDEATEFIALHVQKDQNNKLNGRGACQCAALAV